MKEQYFTPRREKIHPGTPINMEFICIFERAHTHSHRWYYKNHHQPPWQCMLANVHNAFNPLETGPKKQTDKRREEEEKHEYLCVVWKMLLSCCWVCVSEFVSFRSQPFTHFQWPFILNPFHTYNVILRSETFPLFRKLVSVRVEDALLYSIYYCTYLRPYPNTNKTMKIRFKHIVGYKWIGPNIHNGISLAYGWSYTERDGVCLFQGEH